jgi:hypothetical protein
MLFMVSSIHRAERNAYRPKIGKTGIPFPRHRHFKVFFYCYFRILEASQPSWSLIAVWIMTDTRCYLSTCTEYIVRGSFISEHCLLVLWASAILLIECLTYPRVEFQYSMKADAFKYAFGPILVRPGRAKPGNDGWRCQMYTKALLSMHTGERRLSMTPKLRVETRCCTQARLPALNR